MKEFLLNYREHSSKMGSVMELQTILGDTYARELYFKRIKLKIQMEIIKFNRLVSINDLLKMGINKFYIFAHLVNILRKNKLKAFGYLKVLELIFTK